MSFDIDTDNWTHELSGYTDNLHKEILILNISKDDLINENYNCVEEIGRFESGDWDSYASILSEEEAEESKKESEKYRKELEDDDENNEYEYFINTTYLYCENKYVHSVSSYTKEESDKLTDDEALSSHKFSQENLDSLKKDKNTKLEILKDIFTDIDFPDYANEEWYSALAHQKSVAKLEYYWEGILPDYPNVAKTLANNHHINKKLLSDVRNFGKRLEKVEETKNIGYAIEDLVFANPIFIELRFEIFAERKDFFEEFYEPEKRRNSYFPLFLKNPNMPIDVLKKLVDEYDYYEAKEHPNYPKSNNLGVKIKNINEEQIEKSKIKLIEEDKIELKFHFNTELCEEYETDEVKEGEATNMVEDWNFSVSYPLVTNVLDLGIKDEINCDALVSVLLNDCEHEWDDDENESFKYPVFGDWALKLYNDSKSYQIDDNTGSEHFFVGDNNASLWVKITDKDGNVKYETENAFDDIEQDEALAYYLDSFRD